MRDRLGGKGANLAEMTRLGIPVPPGFTISTEICAEFTRRGRKLPAALRNEVLKTLSRVERVMGSRFGDAGNPLLLSVRSGARASMPGMMDTILNLGLNDRVAEGLAKETGDPRFALDSYRRFVQMYGNVVLGIPIDEFEEKLEAAKRERNAAADTDLQPADLTRLIASYKRVVQSQTGKEFPQDPMKQPAERDPRRVGHRSQRAGHGLRESGRGLRHGRGLYAGSDDRQASSLRRVPAQRPGGRCGCRNPHPASDGS
jgi:pyruvate,orthophosphate dikinase